MQNQVRIAWQRIYFYVILRHISRHFHRVWGSGTTGHSRSINWGPWWLGQEFHYHSLFKLLLINMCYLSSLPCIAFPMHNPIWLQARERGTSDHSDASERVERENVQKKKPAIVCQPNPRSGPWIFRKCLVDWGLRLQSNYGYERRCETGLRNFLPTWGFLNMRRNVDRWHPWHHMSHFMHGTCNTQTMHHAPNIFF